MQHSDIAFSGVIAYNKVRNKQENKKKSKGDKKMTARVQYEMEIITSKDYEITLEEFMNWLEENNKKEAFKKSVEKEGMYETAVDFSVPVIMVKYLGKRL